VAEEDDLPLFCRLTSAFYMILVVGIVINPLITVVTQVIQEVIIYKIFCF
jgi:hypothetical protein